MEMMLLRKMMTVGISGRDHAPGTRMGRVTVTQFRLYK